MSNVSHFNDFAQASDFALDDFVAFQEEKKRLPLWFPLAASSIGRPKLWKALTRRINIMDRASFDMLPTHLQNEVWKSLKQMQKEQKQMQDEGKDPEDIVEAFANNDRYIRTANMFCRAGFVDPQIVLTANEEDLPNRKMDVARIAVEDRIAFLLACQDADSEQARQFELFRPETEGDAPAGDDGEVSALSPVGPVGDAGTGDTEQYPV